MPCRSLVSRGTPTGSSARSAAAGRRCPAGDLHQAVAVLATSRYSSPSWVNDTMSSGWFIAPSSATVRPTALAPAVEVGQREVHDRRAGVAGEDARAAVVGHERADRRRGLPLAVRDVEDLQAAAGRPRRGTGTGCGAASRRTPRSTARRRAAPRRRRPCR